MPAVLLSRVKVPLVTEAGLHGASRLSGERKLLSWAGGHCEAREGLLPPTLPLPWQRASPGPNHESSMGK